MKLTIIKDKNLNLFLHRFLKLGFFSGANVIELFFFITDAVAA